MSQYLDSEEETISFTKICFILGKHILLFTLYLNICGFLPDDILFELIFEIPILIHKKP